MRRLLVLALEKADEALDEVLYRPAVVKAFAWLPRWWLCDLAKLSMRLDERWSTGYWRDRLDFGPYGVCEACGRRAAIHVCGGVVPEEEPIGDYLEGRPVHTCGWCHLRGLILDESDVQRELAAARRYSVAWKWRWTIRP